MSDFPPVGMIAKEDSKGFSIEQDDPAIKVKQDGGYSDPRPRYTRRPRRTYTTKFTDISEADRQLLEAFWDTKKGGSVSFTWTMPTSGAEITVRFEDKMKFVYKGFGGNHRWDVAGVKLKEV